MKKISILILTLLVAMAACKKVPEVNKEYVDVERDLITVGTTTAIIQCDYEYIATLKKAFLYYGEGEDATDMNVAEMSVVQKTLYVELGGLKGNTTYSYYYEFVNGFNSMRSVLKTFKTEKSPDTPPAITLPTVITAEVTEITTNSAKSGGEVTNDSGAEVTERGICWSTNANPTISDSHVAAGTGTGAFTAVMSGLEINTTYHVRAYAINEKGTAYGLDKDFTTLEGGSSDAPEGAINGLFSVSPTQKVYFSQGNLQYQASTNTWRFADNQWDYVGDSENGTVFENGIKCDNALISSIYDGWIDLFGWGTSGYNHGAVCWQPWSTGAYTGLYNVYGFSNYNLYDQTGEADWGYNAIYNGGNQENSGWRTLTIDEWDYLLNNRNTVSGIRYAKAKVNGINGIVVLPDDWNSSYYPLDNINGGGASFDNNTISISQWETLEQYGAGFLPITGNRHGTGIIHNSIYTGYYWSASCDYNDNDGSYFIVIQEPTEIVLIPVYRGNGFAVRLAKNAFSQPPIYTPTVITSDVSNVTSNSAYCGGEVTNDGGATVTERGICWSTNTNPSLTDNHVAAGTGTGTFTAAVSGLQTNTTYHVRAYATNEAGTAYGQDVEFTTLEGGGSGDHEYVDLGLPSGILWATCNVGANASEEYGDYFAWGETQTKSTYNWGTYKYCNGDYNQLTKYCNDASYGYNGFTDNLTTLLSEDDAATDNWGNGWRMPTRAEWNELYFHTTITWTTKNGVNGCLFAASNGNSLFLPAASYRWDDELGDVGSYGHYWSSSLYNYTVSPDDAWLFSFDSHGSYWGMYGNEYECRGCGLSVRAVRSSPKN